MEVKKHMWIDEMELKEIRAVQDLEELTKMSKELSPQDLELETWQTNPDT